MLTITNHAGVLGLTWQSWGGAQAVGVGTSAVDNFFPECPAGRDRCTRSATASVTLSDPGQCGLRWVYRHVTIVEAPSGWTTLPVTDGDVVDYTDVSC